MGWQKAVAIRHWSWYIRAGWTLSRTGVPSKSYISNYSLPAALDFWNVSIDHPFRQVDEKWLVEIGNNLSDKTGIPQTLAKLRQRNQSKQAQALDIFFWGDVIVLLDFDPQDITYLSSFSECVEFYKKHFYKLDTAIRHLYAEFLNKRELLEPFQQLYTEYISIFWINGSSVGMTTRKLRRNASANY